MKVLVIPDIHLKTWIFDRAEDILKAGKAERAVCLMDMADDWDMGFQVERYRETFDRAITFAKDYPDTLWCYGNHDISYPWGRLETGYSPYAERTVMSKLEELEYTLKDPTQIAFIHRIDNVIFSHGGLTTDFVRWLNEELLDADIDDVVAAVNDAPQDYLWNDVSPLWLRPQYKDVDAFKNGIYKQVVGHTPVEKIFETQRNTEVIEELQSKIQTLENENRLLKERLDEAGISYTDIALHNSDEHIGRIGFSAQGRAAGDKFYVERILIPDFIVTKMSLCDMMVSLRKVEGYHEFEKRNGNS